METIPLSPTSDSELPPQEQMGNGAARPVRRQARIPVAIISGALVVACLGGALVWRAESRISKVALASAPRPVTVITARDTTFHDSRHYVGTLRPWIEASIGPQFVSAYVDTVLVRPGAVVKRGEVLATLDCRTTNASSQAVAAEARAIDERQKVVADESARLNTLLDGGFVSIIETEQKRAQAASEEANLAAQHAKLSATTLAVSDCVLRAPFDGEVATRTIDPGAFVHPGMPLVSVVDRDTVRMIFDVPESDFDAVGPGTQLTLHVVSTGKDLATAVSRRSPSADPETRTIHVECDVSDPKREIPVNTTGEVRIDVGKPIRATMVPLDSASITGAKAAVFAVEDSVAHKRTFPVLGERGSDLYLDTSLKPGTHVITEGRFAIAEGEKVAPKEVPYAAPPPGGSGKPQEAP